MARCQAFTLGLAVLLLGSARAKYDASDAVIVATDKDFDKLLKVGGGYREMGKMEGGK